MAENALGMPLQTLETVQARLNDRYRALGRWEAVAAEFGVSLGTVTRVAQGYEPRTAALRQKLGLPALQLAPVCPIHHVVHPGRCPRPKRPPKSLADWPVRRLARALRERTYSTQPRDGME